MKTKYLLVFSLLAALAAHAVEVDGIAARVGHDVEEVADRLMDAMLAYGRGEDIDRALWDIHGDMLCIVADLSTMDQDKEA